MKHNQIENDEMDGLFKEAILEAAKNKGRKFIEEAEKDPYLPSYEFNKRIQKMIETEIKPSKSLGSFNNIYQAFSKASMWILLVLILLFVTIPNVAAARDWVTKLVIDSNPKYVSYYLQNNETISLNQDNIHAGLFPGGTYFPSYLPKGMKLVQLVYDGSTITYRFIDGLDKYVMIQVIGVDSAMNVDNENLEEQNIEIVNGIEARYTRKSDRNSVIWNDEVNLFIVGTTLSKEECLRIANGLIK
ncbi:MAG: DUF4367 domain-containing protein [Anaerolineaceae bacterium]